MSNKCYIVIYTFMHHNNTTSKTDAWRKTQEGFFNIFTSHFICKVWNSIFGPGRRSKYNNHPLIILKNPTCGIFFTFVSINLTHILQNNLQRTIMAENTKRITWTTANKILLRRRPSLFVTLARLIII